MAFNFTQSDLICLSVTRQSVLIWPAILSKSVSIWPSMSLNLTPIIPNLTLIWPNVLFHLVPSRPCQTRPSRCASPRWAGRRSGTGSPGWPGSSTSTSGCRTECSSGRSSTRSDHVQFHPDHTCFVNHKAFFPTVL